MAAAGGKRPDSGRRRDSWLTRLARFLREPEYRRERLAARLLGPERYAGYRLGLYRRSGEVHLWMYDRYSLATTLASAGFEDIRRVAPKESGIPGWAEYALDADATGQPHKPDSLYMEARRPG